VRIVICIDTDLSRSKTLCGKFSSRISSRRSSRIFCPTHHPLSCLALGFSARCGAGFSPALHRASHPAHGPMLPGPVPPGLGWPSPCQMGSLVRRPLGPPPGALRWLLRFTPRLRVS